MKVTDEMKEKAIEIYDRNGYKDLWVNDKGEFFSTENNAFLSVKKQKDRFTKVAPRRFKEEKAQAEKAAAEAKKKEDEAARKKASANKTAKTRTANKAKAEKAEAQKEDEAAATEEQEENTEAKK